MPHGIRKWPDRASPQDTAPVAYCGRRRIVLNVPVELTASEQSAFLFRQSWAAAAAAAAFTQPAQSKETLLWLRL
jgi:hypothetical protein